MEHSFSIDVFDFYHINSISFTEKEDYYSVNAHFIYHEKLDYNITFQEPKIVSLKCAIHLENIPINSTFSKNDAFTYISNNKEIYIDKVKEICNKHNISEIHEKNKKILYHN